MDKGSQWFSSEESRPSRKIAWSSYNQYFRLASLVVAATLLSFGLASILRFSLSTFGAKYPPRLWGYLAPYHATDYKEAPVSCIIDQVNILHRHGARFPEEDDQRATMEALAKYQKAETFRAPELRFLTNYTYDLGAESLVELGAEQSWVSGASAYKRYANLVDHVNMPFMRASLSDRVVMSAKNWSEGFFYASGQRYRPNISFNFDEGPQSNNTLDCNNCPKAGEADGQVDAWIDAFASPIADRLNYLAVELRENITAKDVFYLMMICPFESVYHRRYSPFCQMFSEKEFEGFEYALDLEQYYRTGYGQTHNLGRIQGVGYVNELLARLTNKPVKDNTQTNRTLDSNPRTFPLEKKIYTDFSHDHAMVAIYSALGLFDGKPLHPTKPQHDRKWVSSHIVPFSARMSVERLRCTAGNQLYGFRSRGPDKLREELYVRILINDVLQPLPFCGGDHDGLCKLSDFVASQKFSRTDGDGKFFKCGYNPSIRAN